MPQQLPRNARTNRQRCGWVSGGSRFGAVDESFDARAHGVFCMCHDSVLRLERFRF
jgi:hypothetical protein